MLTLYSSKDAEFKKYIEKETKKKKRKQGQKNSI